MTCVLNGSTNGPCPQLGYGTGSTNRISTFGGSSLTYDVDGNLTNDGVYAYTYDAEGRVTSMTGGGLNNTYGYDALGQRVSWSWNGAQYLYDPSGGLLGVFSAQTSSWFFETVTFEGQRRFDYLNGNLYAYHPDALGTMRLATLKDGSVSGDTLLYPWGQSWTSSGSPTNLFAGFQNWDGNVPMYVGQFRAYPVNYGRWLTPDPAGKKAVRLDDPQTWNAYAYVRNNPTTLTDPSGLLTPAGGVDLFESSHVYTGTIESFDQGTEERPAGEQAQNNNQTVGNSTEGDLAKTMTHEDGSLSTPKKGDPDVLGDAKEALANAIINNAELKKPEQVATPDRPASAQDAQVMKDAVTNRANGGADPVEGRHYYGTTHNPNVKSRDAGNHLKGEAGRETVYEKFGPFRDSTSRRPTWIVIYNNPGQ